MFRTRATRPLGKISTWSSTRIDPSVSVPVITVPNPFIVKTRSTGNRKRPSDPRGSVSRAASARACFKASRPVPVVLLTGIIGAFSRNDPATNSSTSSLTNSKISSSTRSALVSAITPRRTPSRRQISKCSRVWGMTDSSAATTRVTMSIPPTPASMFLTKRSWPGTSTNPRRKPGSRSKLAKPRSMVIPRRFSSAQRSVSVPVRARTRDVLPWSMWPLVPTMTCLPGAAIRSPASM